MSQFTISATHFARALDQVAHVVPSNPLVSITSCVMLVGRGSVAGAGAALHLICTNLETRLTSSVAFDCAENFAVCIDARLLLSTLKAFPDAPVSGTLTGDVLALKVGKSNYRLVGESATGFPQVKKVAADARKLGLSSALLHRALTATLTTANTTTNVASAFTNGILVESNQQHVAFVSTCMTRLAALTIDVEDEDPSNSITHSLEPIRALVPRSAAALLHKIIDPRSPAEVTLLFEADTVRLADNRWHTRLMDVVFPEYRPIFPAVYAQQLVIDHGELLAALRRLSPYTDRNDAIVLHAESDGLVNLYADNTVVGHAGEEALSALSYYGESITIGLPASQLVNLLGLWGPGPMTIGLNGPQRGVIINAEGDSADSGLACMIAPTMILSSDTSYA